MWAVVDLETPYDPRVGALTLRSLQSHLGASCRSYGADDDLEALVEAERVVVTGSPAMVEDVGWADEVAAAVEGAAQAGVPVLAICFGHQLMARHFGGRLASFSSVRRGVEPVAFEQTGPFPAGVVPLVHSHRDHVVDPGSLVPCGQGGFGGIAALHHPRLPLWTLQGHPEWDSSVAEADAPHWRDVAGVDTPEAKEILVAFGRLKRKTEASRARARTPTAGARSKQKP